MLGIAIIGAGNIGRIRARVIQASQRAQVKAIADIDLACAQELANASGASATTDWQSAIQSSDVQAVVVCTPTKFHAQVIESALRAGKHVLCEKPLARSLHEAEATKQLSQSTGLVLKTGFNYRYMAHVREAKKIINSGALGPLYFLRCRYGHGGRPGYERDWCTD